ncbi:DUF4331 domain-containing protein [Oceanobacter kriegii]|uniref:DUF4331 domain-containing protein n=1 Tax=Oceanobacter kriegii TaxID=64972 RepID=UPI001FE17FBC|nr:DUF4331 domain-containing protein [Oceanobacter kriegii]
MNTLPKAAFMAVATSVALSAPTVLASSHREAPAITRTPTLDAADFYMFMDYTDADDNGMADNPDHVVLMANYVPLQDAYGGPNYFSLDPNGLYEIHIDQNGDGMEDVTFQFQFSQTLGGDGGVALTIDDRDVDIPLKNFGQIDTTDPAASATNYMETYTVAMVTGDRRSGTRTVLNGGMSYDKPMDNIGEKSFADYASYAAGYVHDLSIDSCSGGEVFVGQRKDPFVVNLGKTFDLVNYIPLPLGDETWQGIQDDANDDLADKNVTTIALKLHKDCLLGESGTVIGGWTTASTQQVRIQNPNADFDKPDVYGGAYVQVSRLGMPLVNEVVIGLSKKDTFNASEPVNDTQFADYVTHPTLPALINILFGEALTGDANANIAPTNFPRADLVTAFLTGFPGVNQLSDGTLSEMVRLNTAVAATTASEQSTFGVVAGDLAGFPNGRRPGDDVVDIALRVVMGALCHPIAVDLDGSGTAGDAGDNLGLCETSDAPVGTAELTDRAPVNVSYFDAAFPYFKAPLPGSSN